VPAATAAVAAAATAAAAAGLATAAEESLASFPAGVSPLVGAALATLTAPPEGPWGAPSTTHHQQKYYQTRRCAGI